MHPKGTSTGFPGRLRWLRRFARCPTPEIPNKNPDRNYHKCRSCGTHTHGAQTQPGPPTSEPPRPNPAPTPLHHPARLLFPFRPSSPDNRTIARQQDFQTPGTNHDNRRRRNRVRSRGDHRWRHLLLPRAVLRAGGPPKGGSLRCNVTLGRRPADTRPGTGSVANPCDISWSQR